MKLNEDPCSQMKGFLPISKQMILAYSCVSFTWLQLSSLDSLFLKFNLHFLCTFILSLTWALISAPELNKNSKRAILPLLHAKWMQVSPVQENKQRIIIIK